jgi:hypothetical protein
MSITHLSEDELATYLIGAAIRRFMVDSNADTFARMLMWTACIHAVDTCLTPEENHHVMVSTGIMDETWGAAPEPMPEFENIDDPDDVVPFSDMKKFRN